ncbi:MAG: hypothetical protein UV74_C0013G0003 [Candidatus Woesebacteria bacterium GW2011_GWB1_43_14]|uniref:Uncharacterized protein n=1 Tax=Candidatus Woesebacteria bacterium GW2011_GWB1_43_14 TaxID=1618578 RepID=A0A0G1FPC4_9BACT|nr:MAG: hypothetical protein UV51_C0009G0003 [Candidatus Woesebacteria bacterium GW2011_GWC1_42_9]KKS96881.1 MAG: hypothetical protein UV74_C0013G0003 [Candidatus Woesebacteria bacterium GW2011_GWB1_43_14]
MDKFIIGLVLATVFAIPILVLPFFQDPFTLSKLIILTIGVCLLILLKIIRSIYSDELEYSAGEYDLPVIFIASSYLLSGIFSTPNRYDAFLVPGTGSFVILGAILYLSITQLKEKSKELVKASLIAGGTVFSLVLILSTTKILSIVSFLPPLFSNPLYTSLGDHLTGAIFLLTIIPLGVGLANKSEKTFAKSILGASLGLIILGLIISVINILPGKQTAPLLVDFATSWAIMIDSLKANPIFGVGPGNYLTAFNRYRPIAFNGTDLWSLRFTTSRNFFMTMTTETGLFGIIGLSILVSKLYKHFQTISKDKKLIPLIIILGALMIFPSSSYLIVLLFIVLSLSTKTSLVSIKTTAKLPLLVIASPIIITIAFVWYKGVNIVKAEYTYNKALIAIANNNGKAAYDLLARTISLNPKIDRYHASYAQINLAIAGGIAQNKEITDEDRTTIGKLAQQAIREAKSTVSLNSGRAGNWEILANTYQSIIPLAQGADQFAIESYNQAIALDPLNPNTRIALGGLLYARRDYTDAIEVYRIVTNLVKPDHPNAHYNLAFAYKDSGQIDKAIDELNIVLSLVPKESSDYETASSVLESLKSKGPLTETKSTNLVPPQETKEILKPPLELPEDSQPLAPTP